MSHSAQKYEKITKIVEKSGKKNENKHKKRKYFHQNAPKNTSKHPESAQKIFFFRKK